VDGHQGQEPRESTFNFEVKPACDSTQGRRETKGEPFLLKKKNKKQKKKKPKNQKNSSPSLLFSSHLDPYSITREGKCWLSS
jgi:hypothetical protein